MQAPPPSTPLTHLVAPPLLPSPLLTHVQFGDTPLHKAARCSGTSVAIVQALLTAYPEAAKVKNEYGDTPLYLAARGFDSTSGAESVAVVQALLKAYPEAAKVLSGFSPALLKLKNKDGDETLTPLHLIVQNSSTSVAMVQAVVQAILVACPEAAKVTDQDGDTPLHKAARNSSTSMAVVKALLEAYPEAAKVKNKDGRTPADEAAKCNRNAEVKAFFARSPYLQATPGQSAAAAVPIKPPPLQKQRSASFDLPRPGGGGAPPERRKLQLLPRTVPIKPPPLQKQRSASFDLPRPGGGGAPPEHLQATPGQSNPFGGAKPRDVFVHSPSSRAAAKAAADKAAAAKAHQDAEDAQLAAAIAASLDVSGPSPPDSLP